MRAIRAANQAEAITLCNKQSVAIGYPRCERLSGALRLDGVAIGANDPRLTCPCTVATNPDARCKYKTTAEVEPIEVTTGSGWVAPVTEAKPACLASLTAGERARIETVPDSERRTR